jgi:hypothetical protein
MISIFAKPPFEMKHLQRVSSIIRGEQICAYMPNCRLNPENGYENDVCVYVKPHIRPGADYKFEKNSYLDVHDGFDLRHTLRKYPEVKAIAISDHSAYVLGQYVKNKIVVLPHHHCNFERMTRVRDKIRKVGITGSFTAFQVVPEVIKEGLKKRGILYEEYSNFYPRLSVARFHYSLDIHLVWRPWKKNLSSPLKVTNAMAFGVPTIALDLDEPSYKEVEGCYIGVKTPEEWLEKLDELIADKKKYDEMSKFCLEQSERYHISEIAKLYNQL